MSGKARRVFKIKAFKTSKYSQRVLVYSVKPLWIATILCQNSKKKEVKRRNRKTEKYGPRVNASTWNIFVFFFSIIIIRNMFSNLLDKIYLYANGKFLFFMIHHSHTHEMSYFVLEKKIRTVSSRYLIKKKHEFCGKFWWIDVS